MNGLSPYPELEGHTFEIISLYKDGPNWTARFAVDGIPYPPFCEPQCNIDSVPDELFLDYMKAQALTMVEAVMQGAIRCDA